MGAVVKPRVILVRPIIGSGTWKEVGSTTKIVERKNNTKVAMAKPFIREKLRILGENCRTKILIYTSRGSVDVAVSAH